MEPFSLLTIGGQMGQIATSFLQTKNFLINTEMRAEQLRNTTLNHEQQLKMFYLQQEYRLRDFSIDQTNKFDQETYKSLLKIHEQRSIECKVPPYPLGQWLKSTMLPSEPVPYVIICTNTYQGDSPFKSEDVIKPLHKVYHNLKEYNSHNSNLMTITETRQYFNTDEDARNFFIRELQCPTILVYSNFIGSSLTIDMLYAGITNEQNIPNINSNRPTFKPKTIRLWEMDYTLIHSIKSKKKNNNLDIDSNIENPYQWKKNLDNLIEAFVGIKVQSLIDEYFQNSYYYSPQSIKYLNDRKEKYSKAIEWKEFENEVIARYDIINQRKINFQEDYHKKFLDSDKVLIKIVLFGKAACGKSALINSIMQQEISEIGIHYDRLIYPITYSKPPYEITEVGISDFSVENKNEIMKLIEKSELQIFLLEGEPYSQELELFDFIYNANPSKSRIVFVNKSDRFELSPKKDVAVIKERINKKMSKYLLNNEDIIFGVASVYDSQNDKMNRSDNPALQERIYKEALILNKLNG